MKDKSKNLIIAAGTFVILAAMLYSCGGGGVGSYGSSSGAPPMSGGPVATGFVQVVPCPASGTTDVSIVSMTAPGFSPSNVGPVPVNTIVKWTNNDTIAHTVTSTSTVPASIATFDSGQMGSGSTVCFKFTSAGTYNYHCSNHPATMIGSVIAQ
jgi:plastocyanin